MEPKLGAPLQASYDALYHDRMTAWRELGARYKADNIRHVCGTRRFTKVLECGAGEGSVLAALATTFAELHAVEISDSGIAAIERRRIPALSAVRKFDGYHIPYPDQAFEMAYCSHVLEHVEHPRLLLRELARVSAYQVFEIPLDYSPRVDGKVATYLGYGHINIFTPALFRFLLRSEGYEIFAERLTYPADEVTRFNWYRNLGLPKTLRRELSLRLQPVRRAISQLRHGQDLHRELGHTAFTCLAMAAGSLKVF